MAAYLKQGVEFGTDQRLLKPFLDLTKSQSSPKIWLPSQTFSKLPIRRAARFLVNFDFLSNLKMVLVNVDQYQNLHLVSSMLPDLKKSSHPIVRVGSSIRCYYLFFQKLLTYMMPLYIILKDFQNASPKGLIFYQ